MDTASDKLTIPQDGSALISWQFKIDGTPVNWTGWTGEVEIRRGRTQSAALLARLSTEDGNVTGTSDGYWNVDFTTEVMAPVPPGTHYGDLRIVSPAGRVEYPIRFTLKVEPTVTDPE